VLSFYLKLFAGYGHDRFVGKRDQYTGKQRNSKTINSLAASYTFVKTTAMKKQKKSPLEIAEIVLKFLTALIGFIRAIL
jgi:hypothetical protein